MNNYFSFVPLYNSFIERYMINSNHSFVIVYIYLLKKTICNEDINLEDISSQLNMLASDIIKALEYWNSKNIILYKRENNNLKVQFLEIKEEHPLFNTNKHNQPYTDNGKIEEIQKLFNLAEKKLAKLLSSKEKEILISFYEKYCMSLEIIIYLITYCIENGKNSIFSMKNVAIDWSENNLNSVEKIESYLKMYNNDFKKIMGFLNIVGRNPEKIEENFMKKWILEYNIPMDIIEEACIRANKKTHSPSFEYTNGILENWYKNNVKDLDDIKKLDIEYTKTKVEEDKKIETKTFKHNFKYNKNSFINYEQEPLDDDFLRKIELMTLTEGVDENDY